MTLDELRAVPYVLNGRTVLGSDCYGLVRLARVHLFGKPWMPEWTGVRSDDKRFLTQVAGAPPGDIRPCPARPGAIATGWRGSLCIHVGIVLERDGRQMILETDSPERGFRGPRLTPKRHFEKRFLKVIYYDD